MIISDSDSTFTSSNFEELLKGDVFICENFLQNEQCEQIIQNCCNEDNLKNVSFGKHQRNIIMDSNLLFCNNQFLTSFPIICIPLSSGCSIQNFLIIFITSSPV